MKAVASSGVLLKTVDKMEKNSNGNNTSPRSKSIQKYSFSEIEGDLISLGKCFKGT